MNILLIHPGWSLPWSKVWAKNFKKIGHNPYYLTRFKPKENIDMLIDGSKVYNHFMHPVPNINEFNDILDKNDIDIVLFMGCFFPQDRGLYSFIQSRNMFIEKGELNKKPIDVLTTEVGFVRNINIQFDPIGPCSWCSYSYGNIPEFNIDQEQVKEWEEFSHKYKEYKFENIKEYKKNEICSILNIQENKQIIFCPLQISRDALLLYQTRWCNGMVEYMHACKHLFDKEQFHIIFKQHPAFKELGNDQLVKLEAEEIKKNSNISFLSEDHEINTPSLLLNSDCTVTVNSSAGMEALIFDKPVISLGFNAWTPVAIQWKNFDNKAKYDEDINNFKDNNTKIRRKSFLYNLMFNYSLTFFDGFDLEKAVKFINKKLVYYQL